MNKLYWIICEEGDKTLYEGRYLGRTRGAALKHMKEQVGRSNLTGLVYTITEIPVPLIREIVAEIVRGNVSAFPLSETRPPAPTQHPETPARYGAFKADTVVLEPADESDLPPRGATVHLRTDYDWAKIKACYMDGRGPKDVAAIMGVPVNTLAKRITREGWARERRQACAR